MLKLDLYDMVDFGKEFDAAGYDLLNHFEGWLMSWKIGLKIQTRQFLWISVSVLFECLL